MSHREDAWLIFHCTGTVALVCVAGWGLAHAARYVMAWAAATITLYQEALSALLLMGVVAAALAGLALVVYLASSKEELPKQRPGEEHMETVRRMKALGLAGPSAIPPEESKEQGSTEESRFDLLDR